MVGKVFTQICFYSKIKNIIFETLNVTSEQHFPSPAALTYRSKCTFKLVSHIPKTDNRVTSKAPAPVVEMPVEITEL